MLLFILLDFMQTALSVHEHLVYIVHLVYIECTCHLASEELHVNGAF